MLYVCTLNIQSVVGLFRGHRTPSPGSAGHVMQARYSYSECAHVLVGNMQENANQTQLQIQPQHGGLGLFSATDTRCLRGLKGRHGSRSSFFSAVVYCELPSPLNLHAHAPALHAQRSAVDTSVDENLRALSYSVAKSRVLGKIVDMGAEIVDGPGSGAPDAANRTRRSRVRRGGHECEKPS